MAAKFSNSSSGRALIALAFPLAALVPVAVPFGVAEVASVGLPGAIAGLGQADAATVRKAKRKAAATRTVCTTTRIKGRKAIRCKPAKLAPVQPVRVTRLSPPAPPITYAAPLPMAPMQAPSPQMPIAPRLAPQPHVSPIAYYWIDQADSYAQAIGNSPPDFSFACGGVDCWAWISRDGEVLIVEPARDGVLQYFFAPRETSPYLARDSYSSFAFDGRDLVQVYDNHGRIYTSGLSDRARYDGQALQQRGRALFSASLRQRRWDRGSATAWSAQYADYGYYDGWNSGWGGGWRDLPDWDRYERDHRHRHPPRHLDDEHRDRDDARRRFEDWHRHGDQGAPPPTGNPVVTPSVGTGTGAVPPPRQPRSPLPLPQPLPPLTDPPLSVTEPPAAPPSVAEQPRRPRPRRELESEPDTPAIPRRGYAPPGDQPVVQIQAAPQPTPMPAPLPAQATDPVFAPPPSPAPVPQYVESAPAPPSVATPAPALAPTVAPTPQPAPPPPASPVYEHIESERPSGDTEQP